MKRFNTHTGHRCVYFCQNSQGYTLVEAVTVVAILAIVAALAGVALTQWKQNVTTRSASTDFYLTLTRARQSALETGADVWVIVYPALDVKGDKGPGAYFVWSDPNMEFQRLGSDCPPDTLCYDQFAPPDEAKMKTEKGMGRLESATYLNDYPNTPLSFSDLSSSTHSLPAPFQSLVDSGCNFCTGSPAHGAIVFSGEGGARFVDGEGKVTVLKTAAIGFKDNSTGTNKTFLAVTRSTGFVAIHTPN